MTRLFVGQPRLHRVCQKYTSQENIRQPLVVMVETLRSNVVRLVGRFDTLKVTFSQKSPVCGWLLRVYDGYYGYVAFIKDMCVAIIISMWRLIRVCGG